MKPKHALVMMLTIFLPITFLNTSCESQVEFQQFADYAIEMDPNSLTMTYVAAKDKNMVDTIPGNGDATIYPTGQVTFSYTLTNTTDLNYRFTVCLFWKNETKALGCEKVTFIGKSSVNLTHTALLSPDSAGLWIEGTDIIVEPIGNDTRPQYFAATLTVDTACPSGETCCSYLPDGSCTQCIDEIKKESCP